MIERCDLEVDVSDGAPIGVRNIATRFVVDRDRWDGHTVLCCFPGGGMSSRYFELEGFDMAAYLADLGLALLLVDHPGIGGSDVPDDGWELTPEVVADADVAAVERSFDLLGLRDVEAIGLGHSMGSMLVAYQQAQHRPYQGLVLAGFSGRGLPEVLTPAEQEIAGSADRIRSSVVELARTRFGTPLVESTSSTLEMLVGPNVSAGVERAIQGSAGPLLAVCGLNALLPGSDEQVLTAVDVPVLLIVAEHDIVGPPHEAPRYFPGSPDLTLHVVSAAFHNSNIAPARTTMWERIGSWAGWLVGAGRSPIGEGASHHE
jgi:pimeloyl-ACP methyl ester carboxylesterase